MMKIIIQLIILLVLSVVGTAQDPVWELQESGTTNQLNEVYFVTDELGYVVGDAGTVLKTVNGGADWDKLSLDFTADFRSVHFVNQQIGFVAGNNANTLYKTLDGGQNWELQDPGLSNEIWEEVNDLYFINENIGFVGSSSGLSRTDDGGNTWSPIGDYTLIDKIDFFNDLVGYASCSLGLLKTLDGGQSWDIHKLASEGDFDDGAIIRSIQAMTMDTVFLGSPYYSAFYSSFDGGQSLNYQTIPILDLDFLSSEMGYALSVSDGFNSTIMKTDDMGATWSIKYESSSDLGINLLSLWMHSDLEGWAVGRDGVILHISSKQATSIYEIQKEVISVFPNPATNLLFIEDELLVLGELKIYDVQGRLCALKARGERYVDVSHLTSGKYYVATDSDLAFRTTSFVKR